MCEYNAEIEDTEHFLLRCHFYSIQRFELFNNISKIDLSLTQLDTKEQDIILLYGYRPNKANALNQDIITFEINFLKKSGRFDKPFISLNQWFYVLLFFFLPIGLLYIFCVLLLFVFLLENKCKFAVYSWFKISCINTRLLINSSFTSSILICFVTSYNLQTLNALCSFVISVWLIMNIESFVFLYVFYLAFLVFHACKFNIIKKGKKECHVPLKLER